MKNKKGISEVVGYVILITVTIALSVLVYNWLSFYISPGETEKCPDGVGLVIKNYGCSFSGGVGVLNLTLQNKGLFSVVGFSVKVNDAANATIGVYGLNPVRWDDGEEVLTLTPGNETKLVYPFSSFEKTSGGALIDITLIEIQPIVESKDKKSLLHCANVVTQKIVCK